MWQWLFQNLCKCQIKSLCIQFHHFMANGCRKNGNSDRLFYLTLKSLWTVIAALKLKDTCSLEEKLWQTSVQFSHSVMSNSSQPHGLQHARLSCPSSPPEVYSNSCPLSWWHQSTISHPLLLLPSIFPSIRVFSTESILCIRWPKYWSFSFSICPSNEYSGLISFRMGWLDLLAVQGALKSLLQHHSSKASILQHSAFFIVQPSHPYMTTGKTKVLTRQTFVGKVMPLLFNMLSKWS